MLPFHLQIRAGTPIYEQIVHAARRAMLAGVIKPGDRFPSVRDISRECSINPNTVQKAISHLVQEGLLEIHPGVGSIVAQPKHGISEKDIVAIREKIEVPALEARSLGMSRQDFQHLCLEIWDALSSRKKER